MQKLIRYGVTLSIGILIGSNLALGWCTSGRISISPIKKRGEEDEC